MKLYVGNLSFETTENDLQDLFEQHGAVNEVRLMMDRMTGKSRGFAFVTMNDGAQANAAMAAVNGHELNGRALTVNEARPREETSTSLRRAAFLLGQSPIALIQQPAPEGFGAALFAIRRESTLWTPKKPSNWRVRL